MAKVNLTQISPRTNTTCIESYVDGIPSNIRDLILPDDPAQQTELCENIRRLRVREVERDYVMDLQQAFNLPIRPNESVKATMIRLRLDILRVRLAQSDTGHNRSLYANLPTDPLE